MLFPFVVSQVVVVVSLSCICMFVADGVFMVAVTVCMLEKVSFMVTFMQRLCEMLRLVVFICSFWMVGWVVSILRSLVSDWFVLLSGSVQLMCQVVFPFGSVVVNCCVVASVMVGLFLYG